MVRKQLNITEELDCALAERARELGVSQSEVVRIAMERFVVESEAERRERAWEDLERHWREADERGAHSGGSRPTREELHERPGHPR